MKIEEIRNLISEAEYDYIGIRADDRDHQIGEVMDNSHQLFQELDGTCALEVSENNIEEMIEAVKSYGEKIYLIGGNSMEYGNDVDEIIIRDAEVIAVL